MAILTVLAIGSILAIFASGFAKLTPTLSIVVGDIPILSLYLQLRCDTICSILTVSTILAIFSILAVLAVLTVNALCFDFITIGIEQPIAVECPIIDAIAILSHTYHRSVAVFAIFTVLSVLTIGSIFAMIYGNGVALDKRDGITNGLAIFYNGSNSCDIVVGLQRCHNGL